MNAPVRGWVKGADPSADNKLADFFNKLIEAFEQGGVVAMEAYITSLDPAVLAIPIVAWFVDQGVSYIGQFISIITQKAVTGIVIDLQTNGEESTVLTTATALALAQGSGDQNAITDAKNKAISALGSLIHWDGSSQPVTSP